MAPVAQKSVGLRFRTFRADCITFCNLTGNTRPTDVLVKTRYTQIWAYNRDGKQLWTSKNPAGCQTAHQVRPMDVDGDRKDELVVGYAMLNADGSSRWDLHKRQEDGRPPGLCPTHA